MGYHGHGNVEAKLKDADQVKSWDHVLTILS
jgi:hypothetical protein